ncbi:hypothetical protein BJF83_09540 [Nocardiopsis sp. CNR-923]|nr:hypothetical protein BJF83_09540 [Nocardiopsis sp. CNR-923]
MRTWTGASGKTSGNRADNSNVNGPTPPILIVVGEARRAVMSCIRSSMDNRTDRARTRTNSPSSVGRTPERPRWNRGPPTSRSIRWSCVVSAGCDVDRAAAALVTLPVSARRQRVRRWRSSRSMRGM